MERRTIRNIVRGSGKKTVFGKVVRKISATAYEVEDVAGPLIKARAADGEMYGLGSMVEVEDGRIVGSGRRKGKHKVYRV